MTRAKFKNNPMPDTTYDYIIIGAGSAGCVLANRLSAQPDRTVLLLEAGASDCSSAIHTPAAFPTLFKSKLDWNYMTEPQVGLDGRSLKTQAEQKISDLGKYACVCCEEGSRSSL
jgi:choline dehydrogenase-like flavoprotein